MRKKDVVENIDRWLTELRSGNHKQGHNLLCNVNEEGEREYCCLGIVAEYVLDLNNFKHEGFGYIEYYVDDIHSIEADLGRETHKKLGLIDSEGSAYGYEGGGRSSLTCLNDFNKKTFTEIADYIEKE